MARKFNWDSDCGNYKISDVLRDIENTNQTIEQYVHEYALSDPFKLGNNWLDERGMIETLRKELKQTHSV